MLNGLDETWTNKAQDSFNHILHTLLPPQHHRFQSHIHYYYGSHISLSHVRVGDEEEKVREFVEEIVPQRMDETAGEFRRRVAKDKETFEIEQQKEARREGKLVKGAGEHFQDTSQGMVDERALWAGESWD